jgi:hypothetical protein
VESGRLQDSGGDLSSAKGGGGEDSHAESLCHRCAAHRYVKGRATVFVMCTALPVKYPPQPVVRCEAFRAER